MDLNGLLHAPAALLPVPIGQEAGEARSWSAHGGEDKDL